MELNNKYEIGDKVYSYSKKHLQETCKLCNGDTVITVKTSKGEKTLDCVECHGFGYKTSHFQKYTVDEGIYTVKAIKANIDKNKINIKYSLVDDNGRKINRAEPSIFKDKNIVESKCKEMNYSEEVPVYLTYNKKAIKEKVDVFVSNGFILKNIFKPKHETKQEDINLYIENDKTVCIEEDDICTLYSNDFIKIKEFSDCLKASFPDKTLVVKTNSVIKNNNK